jgi:alpha-beta hydrolase superfamily lysophospholipase
MSKAAIFFNTRPAMERPSRIAWARAARWLALGAAGSLALLAGAAYPLSGLLVRPRSKHSSRLSRPHLANLIRRMGMEVEDIEFYSTDGTRIRGWWMEAGKRRATIVILHGASKNRTDVIRTALVLRRAGFNIGLFDGRGHGQSEGSFVTYGFHERHDAESILEYIVAEKGADRDRIGLAGESMGAAIALQVAARNERVRAVWADSPFASLTSAAGECARRVTRLPRVVLNPLLWATMQMAAYRGGFDAKGIAPLTLAGEIKCPVFLVHGSADRLIDVAHSKDIFKALGCAKQLWIVEGARHTRAARFAKCVYSERITQFFLEALGDNDSNSSETNSGMVAS